MNDYQIQTALRKAIEGRTGEQLSRVEEGATKLIHRKTGQSFCALAAEHLAAGVKRNGADIERIIRIAPRYPGLAQELLRHFPDEEALTDIAEGWVGPEPTPRDAEVYLEERYALAGCTADKCIELASKGGRDYALCVEYLMASAEGNAGWIGPSDRDDPENFDPPKRHLEEERIDALATLLSLFANQNAATAVPVE